MDGFLGLVPGQILSDIADLTKDQIKGYAKRIELVKNLDDYDRRFIEEHDTDLDRNKTNMEFVIKKRDRLVTFAKGCLNQSSVFINNNRKNEFISLGCRELEDDTNVVKRYLDGFYDLVYWNETKSIPSDQKALIAYLVDLISEKDKEYSGRYKELNIAILELIKRLEALEGKRKQSISFNSYYQIVEDRFTKEKTDVYKNLVGSMPDEKAYIDVCTTVDSKIVSVLSFLEEWFGNTKDRVVLIYGEPGHGKSLLCDKAVYEFHKERFLKGRAKNVIAVSLNTGVNRRIVMEREIDLESAFNWKTSRKNTFSFEDCRGALLFMDGFDEFIDEAKQRDSNIKNIYDFMQEVNDIASNNDIYIVILSRTMAVIDDLDNLKEIYRYYKLLPISEEQQNKWIEKHKEYNGYKETLCSLQNNDDMKELLGVPLLFRLIVHNQFKDISSNEVELYNNLFKYLLLNRHVTKPVDIQAIERELANLAYKMYCTDTYMAYYDLKDSDNYWALAFYVCAFNKRQIGFFHRSFYQFFLAKYVYLGLISLVDENAEEFIGSFAERELDATVRHYLSLMFDQKDKLRINASLEIMINTLSKTEAYLSYLPRVKSGDADKSRILRSQNIYRNLLYLVAVFSYKIKIPFKGNLDVMARKYRSEGIVLLSNDNDRADLKEACLAGAYLKYAKLDGADLTKVDLRGADLRNACLTNSLLNGARLIEANFREADLTDAKMIETSLNGAYMKFTVLKKADLSYAYMRGTDLTRADLSEANLRKANMRGADLRGARLINTKMEDTNLKGADLRGAEIISSKMEGTYLRGVDLTGAIISGVDLNNTFLNEAKIDIKYKEIIDPSTEGYDSIIWVSYDKQKMV